MNRNLQSVDPNRATVTAIYCFRLLRIEEAASHNFCAPLRCVGLRAIRLGFLEMLYRCQPYKVAILTDCRSDVMVFLSVSKLMDRL